MTLLRRIKRSIQNETIKRELRNWNILRPFPPNFNRDHQVFYPSLDSVLNEREKLEDGKNFVDIGLEIPRIPGKSRYTRRTEKATVQTVGLENLTEDKLYHLVSTEEKQEGFDYDLASESWSKSKSGMEDVVQLANHYNIFEHLFNFKTVKPVDKTIPHSIGDFWPQIERKLTWELEKYYPGSVRIDPPPVKEVHFFHPIVPMRIEFAVQETPDDEELSVSNVYRGNHIKPKYTHVKPDILIDASFLNESSDSFLKDRIPNGIELYGDNGSNLFTLTLVNLDSQYGSSDPICHWMVSNISSSEEGTKYDEVMTFIPPYAFRGFGYHRYVFVLFKQSALRHVSKIDDFDLDKRKLDLNQLVSNEGAIPVGLAWFQSSWDETCRKIFHEILNMREPTYDYIQPQRPLAKQARFPGRVPFNVYLDLYRDPKEINKQVALERISKLDPFDYAKNYTKPKAPAAIFTDEKQWPKWYWSTLFKKDHQLGPYRLLRNPSSILPLNNNSDLDYPIWPHTQKIDLPMKYPYKGGRRRPLKESKWALPLKEHPSLRDEDEDIVKMRNQELKEDLDALELFVESNKSKDS